MSDELEKNGDKFDAKLFEEMWGIPVVRTSANVGAGVDRLLDLLTSERTIRNPEVQTFGAEIDGMIGRVSSVLAEDPASKRAGEGRSPSA